MFIIFLTPLVIMGLTTFGDSDVKTTGDLFAYGTFNIPLPQHYVDFHEDQIYLPALIMGFVYNEDSKVFTVCHKVRYAALNLKKCLTSL